MIKKLKVMLPSAETQTQFSDLIERVNKVRGSMDSSLEQLETLRKALMQEYFG